MQKHQHRELKKMENQAKKREQDKSTENDPNKMNLYDLPDRELKQI